LLLLDGHLVLRRRADPALAALGLERDRPVDGVVDLEELAHLAGVELALDVVEGPAGLPRQERRVQLRDLLAAQARPEGDRQEDATP
jgi:hypothetical protein